MSETNHTPGPLVADDANVRRAADGSNVAIAYDPDHHSDLNSVTHANARLFAAAPELLAACLTARDEMVTLAPRLSGPYARNINAAVDQLKAAIAKAVAS